MIIPKEKPFIDGLNSYYLDTDKFIEHLQGEIGTGCVYFNSSGREILIYFDEMDVIRGVIQEPGQSAKVSPSMVPIFEAISQRNYLVSVTYLDPNAIFYWAQIPPFKRSKSKLSSSELPLVELMKRLVQKKVSCFLEVDFEGISESCILFFNEGEFTGASYSWGKGGLNPSRDEFKKFLNAYQSKKAVFTIGHFQPEQQQEEMDSTASTSQNGISVEDQVFLSNLSTVMGEFTEMYVQTVKKKAKAEPVDLLYQRIVVRADEYPFMDPFNPSFDYADGVFSFTEDADREKTAKAVIDCAWDIVDENRLQKKFKTVLSKWTYKSSLKERDYLFDR